MNPGWREQDYAYPVYVDVSMCSAAGALYPAAYQRIAVETIGRHLEAIEIDTPRISAQYGVAWVLLSMSVALMRPIRIKDRLTLRTWHTRYAPPTYRREIAFYDEENTLVAVGATFSSLLDVRTHRLCMDRSILSRFDLPGGEELLHAEKRFSERADFAEVERRTVRPSWIDGLGHVNNERYGEFAYDALTAEERGSIGALKRLDVWFKTELTEGAEFAMERAETKDAVILRGVIQPEGRESFLMKLTF